jgi:hypothetical protein
LNATGAFFSAAASDVGKTDVRATSAAIVKRAFMASIPN